MVKNLLANVGVTGSTPDLRRIPRFKKQLSSGTTTTEACMP